MKKKTIIQERTAFFHNHRFHTNNTSQLSIMSF